MLKLLLFAPCEKVIISDSGTTSLITLMEAMNLQIPRTVEVPEDATLPIIWWVCTLWTRQDDDIGKTFVQKVEMVLPDGRIRPAGTNEFVIKEEHHNFRNLVQVLGFPVVEGDSCVLKLYLREKKDGQVWEESASFPIQIHRIAAAESQAD